MTPELPTVHTVEGADGDGGAAADMADAEEGGGGGGSRGTGAVVVGAGAPPLPSVTDYDGSAADNRDYTDTNTAQRLTQEDLAALKAEGKTGQAIIQVGGEGWSRLVGMVIVVHKFQSILATHTRRRWPRTRRRGRRRPSSPSRSGPRRRRKSRCYSVCPSLSPLQPPTLP